MVYKCVNINRVLYALKVSTEMMRTTNLFAMSTFKKISRIKFGKYLEIYFMYNVIFHLKTKRERVCTENKD